MKIMIIGSGPLPRENRGVANAAGLRTEQFLHGIEGRHHVSLVVVENTKNGRKKGIEKKTIRSKKFSHVAIPKSLPNIKTVLTQEIQKFSPDVILGINTFPAYLASQVVPKNIPFWADLNGWVMTEMQAQAYSQKSNAFLMNGHRMETEILQKADKISTVSSPQKHACMGELASIGRLSKDNFRHEFTETVENACLPLRRHEKRKKTDIFRGKIFPKNADVILWLGGFNAWADEETLLKGILAAMKKNKNLHLVCTGDILPGIEEEKFPWFVAQIKKSKYANRFHCVGWLPAEKIPQLLHECDAGINVDIWCPETQYGARNRLNEFLRFNLPIITTKGAEISDIIEEYDAGKVCSTGKAGEITTAIEETFTKKAALKKQKINAETLKNTRFSATITQSSLQKWLKNPSKAPDMGKSAFHSKKMGMLHAGIAYYKQRGTKAFLQKLFQFIR